MMLKSVLLSAAGAAYAGSVALFLFWDKVVDMMRRGH